MKRAVLSIVAVAIGATMMMSLTSCDNHAKAGTTVGFSSTLSSDAAEQTVYICTGPQSKRFHKTPHCRGFNKCSGEVREVTISKAQSMGRTPCRWCYK